MIPKKWLKIFAISVSLPSSIFGTVIFLKFLESKQYLSTKIANILIIVFICYFLGLIIYYALRKK